MGPKFMKKNDSYLYCLLVLGDAGHSNWNKTSTFSVPSKEGILQMTLPLWQKVKRN